MKRLKCIPVLLLTLLALTCGAFAAEIHGVSMKDYTVHAYLKAEKDCTLVVTMFDADGHMLSCSSEKVTGMEQNQTVKVFLPAKAELAVNSKENAMANLMSMSIIIKKPPTGSYVKAFLLENNTYKPLCSGGDSRDYTWNVYAILYDDGTMVFQYGDKLDATKVATNVFPVSINGYTIHKNAPWSSYEISKNITTVKFNDIIKPNSLSRLLAGCTHLESIECMENLITENVISMAEMFLNCEKLSYVNVSGFDTSNVKNMAAMFSSCHSLEALDVSNFNTSNVMSMMDMFRLCENLESLDISSFDTSNVNNMGGMFQSCRKLKYLDVSNFNTSNVAYMGEMFSGCSKLETLDVSHFDTSNVISGGIHPGMWDMFNGCSSLTNLDVTSFNTKSVGRMDGMFAGCKMLTTLDLSSFDTRWVWNMESIFYNCACLSTITVSDLFSTSNVTKGERAFYHCTSLIGGSGTTYDENHTDAEYARIDGGPDAPGYFTLKNP